MTAVCLPIVDQLHDRFLMKLSEQLNAHSSALSNQHLQLIDFLNMKNDPSTVLEMIDEAKPVETTFNILKKWREKPVDFNAKFNELCDAMKLMKRQDLMYDIRISE